MEWLSVVGSFLLGLLVGALAKRILSAALILVALFITLMAFGYISHDQLVEFLRQIGMSAAEAAEWVVNLRNVVPYTSIAFIAGLILGFWKG